jgi:hypothetical protein
LIKISYFFYRSLDTILTRLSDGNTILILKQYFDLIFDIRLCIPRIQFLSKGKIVSCDRTLKLGICMTRLSIVSDTQQIDYYRTINIENL